MFNHESLLLQPFIPFTVLWFLGSGIHGSVFERYLRIQYLNYCDEKMNSTPVKHHIGLWILATDVKNDKYFFIGRYCSIMTRNYRITFSENDM